MSRVGRRGDGGLTVVEMLVAVTILGIVLLAINALLLNGITQAANSRRLSDAAGLAQRDLETFRDLPYASIPAGTSTKTVTVGTQTYTVTRTVVADDPEPNIKHITVRVTWQLLGAQSYVAETYFADLGK